MPQPRVPAGLLTALLLAFAACAPEATAPQGGGSVSTRVVPIVVPDIWCPAMQDTTAREAKNHERVVCNEQAPSGPSLRFVVDSSLAQSDSPR